MRRIGQQKSTLQRVNVRVDAGQFVAICGHNGAGKTTFARVLAGLIPLASGDVSVFGEPIRRQPSARVQMVFQPPAAQVLGSTVYEELAMTLAASPASSEAQVRPEAVRSICRDFDLDIPLDTPIHHLSGGQLARLCIAQCIMSGADVLILDEALQELNPAARARISVLLRQLTQSGKTILSITHHMEDVLACDRVLLFHAGTMVGDWTPAEFFYGESPCEQWGFEPPYLVRVAKSIHPVWARQVSPLSEEQLVEVLVHGHQA